MADPPGAAHLRLAQESERSFRPLEEHADACSSYAEVTYRKRRSASSSTPPMADDPIRNRGTKRRPRSALSRSDLV